jgi:hypothetical protein
MMDNDYTVIKWLMLPFCCIAIGTAASIGVESYSNAMVERAAIENGYEQVIEDGKTLWKPTNENK